MTGRRAVRWLIVIGILIGVLVAADRISSVYAGQQAAKYLDKRADFAKTPSVDINGFPFITQAIAGRYRDVEVRSGPVKIGSVQASALDVHLKGAHLPLSSAFSGPIHQLAVDTVTGTVTFSYAEVVRLSDLQDLALSDAKNGALDVSATVALPGAHVTSTVSGVAKLSIVNGALRLSVSDITVAGVSLPASEIAGLAAVLAVPIPIPALPFGLKVNSVTAHDGKVIVAASGSQVVISGTP